MAIRFICLCATSTASYAGELRYEVSNPPLEVTFSVLGGHYSGVVTGGNLFLQPDIVDAPKVRWKKAKPGSLYTLMMIDFDGNADGSWPDEVPEGVNSPVRHWIVGNIPGELLRKEGYVESRTELKSIQVIQPYRSPHIPVVSDRYALYLFEQKEKTDFAPVADPITNFDHKSFIEKNQLGGPKASNHFVSIYTSESPFSGKVFTGNDVSETWHKNLGKGRLR